MFPRYQRCYQLSNGWKPFRTFLIGRLEITTSHWHTSFVMSPTHQLLLRPLLLVSLTPLSMDLLKLSSLHEHCIPMHYSTMISLTYTSSWRKQHEALNMLPPLNPTNKLRMVVEHGRPLPANMLGKTSGRLRSRSKSNCYTHMFGKARVTSRSNTLSPNIAMHMYQCQPMQNMFNTNCPMKVLALVS